MELTSVKLVEVLKATLHPDHRANAEKQLEGVCKEDGFVPILLHFVMSDELEMPVRQAGVVYMKNTIVQYWDELARSRNKNAFVINDGDKKLVRDNIIQAILASSNLIRVQLAVCVRAIVRCDYPDRWPSLTEQLLSNLQSERHGEWLGCLICLHQLVKTFEYQAADEKKVLNEAMSRIFPVIHRIGCMLVADQSEPSVRVQMHILKILYSHIQYWLPLEWISREQFTEWMELVRSIADCPLPEECNRLDNEEKCNTVWWKSKKWALNIVTRCFERYGSPGNVQKEYSEFSEWFLRTFSGPLIHLMLKFLDMYRSRVYVSDRVLQLAISFITHGVNHGFSWKVIKVHVNVIVQDIVFPLMCHSNADDELWTSDPVEYIRIKYNVYEEYFNPSTAAQTFLSSTAANRRNMLDETMNFLSSMTAASVDKPHQKSGVLQMLGTLATTLIQRKRYRGLLEGMLMTHVCPELVSKHGYLRARACWVISCFSKLNYKDHNNLSAVLGLICAMLHSDKELPVRVEAALALQDLIIEHDNVQDILRPSITQIIGDLLTLIRDTENDELASALQKFVCQFSGDITPLAVEVTKHLADTFICIMDSSADADTSNSKSMAIMGILSTMETVCTVMEDHAEILQQIEDVVSSVISYILQNEMLEYFEEVLSLVSSLTSQQVSLRMWMILPLLAKQLYPGNLDYFTEMMPCLHNYIVIGGANFLSHPPHVEMIFSMCKTVLSDADVSEDVECHAAKLLETILLQYRGGPIDHLVPAFIELSLSRLRRPFQMVSSRATMINVIIAALLHNPPLVITLLDIPANADAGSILNDVIRHWLTDSRSLLGVHDKKMFVIGMSTLLSIPTNLRPHVMISDAVRVLPSMICVFKGLKRAYELRNRRGEPWHKSDSDAENGEHDDEEDIVDENKLKYHQYMEKAGEGGESSENDEETTLECYETAFDTTLYFDEYIMFAAVFHNLAVTGQAYYQLLTTQLNESDKKDLGDVLQSATERRMKLESLAMAQHATERPTTTNSASSSSTQGAGDGL